MRLQYPDTSRPDATPGVSRLAQAVGPCYSYAGIARQLRRSAQEIAALVEECELVALTTSDDYEVFPTFQVEDGRVVPNLAPVIHALQRGIDDPWTWALWLNSPPSGVGGNDAQTSRIQQLIDGELDRVLRAAERTAASWRS